MNMTHKVSTGKGSWLFVEVPEAAFDMATIKNILMGYKPTGGIYWERELPPGSYTFIGTTKDISEEQCREIVEMSGSVKIDLFNDYRQGTEVWLMTATESLRSLLIANQMNPELNYAILKNTLTN